MQNRIRYWRKQLGWSQEKLALAIEPQTTNQNIGKLERAGDEVSLYWLIRIAPALGRTVDDLLPEEVSLTSDPQTARLLVNFRQLSDADKDAILRISEGLARKAAA